MSKPRLIPRLLALVGPALLLLAWQATYSSGLLNRTLLPSPGATLARLFQLVRFQPGLRQPRPDGGEGIG